MSTRSVSAKAILVTGGAGYIGSHVLLQLLSRGERAVVLDNLYTGFRQAVRGAPLIVGDVGDRRWSTRVLREHADRYRACISPPIRSYPNRCAIRSNTTATTPARPATCSSAACATGVRAVGVLLHRGGVWHPARRHRRRGYAARADQSVRQLQADVRVDPARSGGGERLSLCEPALFQRRRLRPAGPHRPGDPAGDAADQGGLRGRGRQTRPRLDLRHRLRHPRRHRRARLHPRRGPGARASGCARLSARGAEPP